MTPDMKARMWRWFGFHLLGFARVSCTDSTRWTHPHVSNRGRACGAKGVQTALPHRSSRTLNCVRLDQHTARSQAAQTLRSEHRRRLDVSEQFPRILVRDSEKTAAKEIRYSAESDARDAPAVTNGDRGMRP